MKRTTKRTARVLLNLLTVVGVLVSMASAVMWRRSWHMSEHLVYCPGGGGRLWWVRSEHGLIDVTSTPDWPTAQPWRVESHSREEFGDWGPMVGYGLPGGGGWQRWDVEHAWLTAGFAEFSVHPDNGRLSFADEQYAENLPTYNSGPRRTWTVGCRWWVLTVLGGLPLLSRLLVSITAGTVRRWRRARRYRSGVCLYCGYDLTGNASGVCPECGTVAAPAPLADDKRAPPLPPMLDYAGPPANSRRLRRLLLLLGLLALLWVAAFLADAMGFRPGDFIWR